MTEVNNKVEINPKKYKQRGWIRVGSGIDFHVNVYQAESTSEDAKKFASVIAEFLELEKLGRDLETAFDCWQKLPEIKKLQTPEIEIESNGGAVPSCGVHVHMKNPLWEIHKEIIGAPFYYISFEYERGRWLTRAISHNGTGVVPAEALELERRLRAVKDEL